MGRQILYAICIFLFLWSPKLFTQNKPGDKVISGRITDSNNKPIKGAFIFVDSVKTKVKTNRKGIYKMKVSHEVSQITAFSLYHGILSMKYSGQEKVDFIFPYDNEVIKEAELILMGFKVPERKKGELRFNDKMSVNTFRNIYEMIAGRFPNVKVSGESISIRNAAGTSGGSSTEPLLLVNGSQVSTIRNIAPVEVKSIKVLRGSDTSFYGARGAFGVIKIELK